MYKLLKSEASKKRTILHVDPFKDRHSKSCDLPYWKGVAVGIDISLKQKPEFSQLLDFITETYINAIKEQKKSKYKKAKFI
jgi:hypothetical protein